MKAKVDPVLAVLAHCMAR